MATGQVTICAAHPADTLTEKAVRLLEETAGVPAVCLNPQAQTFEAMVDEIEEERVRRGIDRWIFWGISGGGWLGQIYARKYPKSLSGVILESICPCFRLRLADPACILSPFHPSWRDRVPIDPHSHDEASDTADGIWSDIDGTAFFFHRPNGPALFVSPFPVTDAMRRMTPEFWRFDARAWLPEIETPALILCGDADPIVPVAHARALAGGIPNAQLVILEGAGHSPVMARRTDLAQAVRAFVSAPK